MGAAGSKNDAVANVEDPFPISQSMNRQLDRLSMVAARVLSTPDIYDIENLAKPGVCGEYAVFLKKEIEKDVRRILKPYVSEVDLEGKGIKERTEILYVNPRRSIKNDKAREEICKSITNSMVRTISIITACLASIQVAVPARKVAVSGIGLQKGGGHSNVHGWLVANSYYVPTDTGKPDTAPKQLNVATVSASEGAKYILTLTSSSTTLTQGTLNAVGGTARGSAALPSGSLKIQFMDPIIIPSTSPTSQYVLPIRIVDGAGVPWLAGVLYNRYFKSFFNQPSGKPQQYDLTDVLYNLFRKAQGWTGSLGSLFETRTETQNASAVFIAAQRSSSPVSNIVAAIGPWFYSASGTSPAAGVPPPPMPGYAAPYAPGASPYGYPYGIPPAGAYGAPPSVPFTVPVGMPSLTGTLKPPTSTAYYTIPQIASKNLLETLNDFRNKLAVENSPAAIRAQTLGGVPTRDRTIQTNVCQDPYWIMPSLSRVYPWATLQFLCIKEWDKLSGDRSRVPFEPEWTNFIADLGALYNGSGVPQLERTGASSFLDQMKFKDVNKLAVCKSGPAPRVKFKEVQDGLLEIQGLYDRHVQDIWALLNDLIIVVEDPDTKQDFVRLNSQVLDAANTESYVATKAAVARKLIADFYLAVERAYLKAAGNLIVV